MKKFIFLFCFAFFILSCEKEVVDDSSNLPLDANLIGVWCKLEAPPPQCRCFSEHGKHFLFKAGDTGDDSGDWWTIDGYLFLQLNGEEAWYEYAIENNTLTLTTQLGAVGVYEKQ
mgnify:FL=1|tara:strand:+ start:483 stop:827 length:345 start_codon:yes stop_codon:yes gene_type:complete